MGRLLSLVNKIINQNGFSLVELLFVLGILSFLLLLIVPLSLNHLEHQREMKFLEQLKYDVLYIQNISMTNKTRTAHLYMSEDYYQIYDRTIHDGQIKRYYPDTWNVDTRVMSQIAFNKNGTMQSPGKFTIQTKQKTYEIIFPLGKGRFYIVEQ